MNPTRDEILRILKVLFFQSADVDRADIQSLDIMRYAEAFSFTDDRQIPDIGKVKSLIADVTGNGTIERLYTRTGSDVTDYELDLSAETDIPYPAVESLKVNGKSISAATWDFSTKKWSGLPDTVSGDVIEAYYVGREYTPPVFISAKVINNSADSVYYTTPGFADVEVLAAQTVNIDLDPGQNASVTMLLDTQSCTYTVYDVDDSVYFTFTQAGPSTVNGLAFSAGRRQEFVISQIF